MTEMVVLKKKSFKVFNNVFLLFHNYLHFEKGMALDLKKHESPPTKDALRQTVNTYIIYHVS